MRGAGRRRRLTGRIVIARLLSTAGTGYIYTTRRLRVADRLSMMKYDPVGTWEGEMAATES